MADIINRFDQFEIDFVLLNFRDEKTVDLKKIDWQGLEIGERLQTAAEIIESEETASFA